MGAGRNEVSPGALGRDVEGKRRSLQLQYQHGLMLIDDVHVVKCTRSTTRCTDGQVSGIGTIISIIPE